MPLAVARESSVRLIDEAVSSGSLIAVFTQREASEDEPLQDDLYPVGTASHIHKMFKLPDGSLRIIVQGLARVRLGELVNVRALPARAVERRREVLGRRGPARDRRAAAEHQDQLPADRLAVAADVGRSADAGHQHRRARPARGLHRLEPRSIRPRHEQEVLETLDVRQRLDLLNRLLIKELEVLELGSKIQSQVQSGGRQEPARLLPARAAQGDSARARRGRRSDEGDRRAPRRRSKRRACPRR